MIRIAPGVDDLPVWLDVVKATKAHADPGREVAQLRLYVGPSGRTVRMIKAPITLPFLVVSHASLAVARRCWRRWLKISRSSSASRSRRPSLSSGVHTKNP